MPDTAPEGTETQRIRAAYEKRINERLYDRYSLLYPGELYMLQRREEEILASLVQAGIKSLWESHILEVGCGRGMRLADWLRWGAQHEHLSGIDLMPDFIETARQYLPSADLRVGGGDNLPYPGESFDIVIQQTVFTSIQDTQLKQAIAGEMLRVLKPGGLLLWYDFRYPNPKNRDVQPVHSAQIRTLFAGCTCRIKSTTLLPPVARRLGKVSFTLCRILEWFPPFRSHLLALVWKPRS